MNRRFVAIAFAIAVVGAALLVSRGRPPAPAGEAARDELAQAPKRDAPDPRDPRSQRLAAVHRARALRLADDAARRATSPVRGRDPVGALDADYASARMAEIEPHIDACYQAALVARPELEGHIALAILLSGEPDAGGVVESIDIEPAASTLFDDELLACVRDAVYPLAFPAPTAGGRVRATYPLVFSAGG